MNCVIRLKKICSKTKKLKKTKNNIAEESIIHAEIWINE